MNFAVIFALTSLLFVAFRHAEALAQGGGHAVIYPPRHFDTNEWCVLGYLLLTAIIAWRLPKRFPLSLTVTIFAFCMTDARVFDHILAGPRFPDLYDLMDLNRLEWFDLVTYIMYAPSGYIFVYLYDRWELTGLQVPLYLLVWSSVSLGIEWLLHLGHVYTYKEWSIAYSFAVYLLVQPCTLWMFRFLKSRYEGVKCI